MAEIQRYLEELLPEMECLRKHQIFSEQEVTAIIKKRTDFEYAVRRPNAKTKSNEYLRYIQYEMNLDLLRRKRKRRRGIRMLPEVGEYGGFRRIHFLFNRMLARSGSVAMWMQYIDFCVRAKSNIALSKVFVRAIQAHPAHAPFWVMTASWEFEHNLNIQAARGIMTRGTNLLKGNALLWREFFRLELFYRQKIADRIAFYGIDASALVAKPKSGSVDQTALPTSLEDSNNSNKDDGSGGGDGGDEMDRDDTETENEQTPEAQSSRKPDNAFLSGAIPIVIFKNAIKQRPRDLQFRIGLLSVLDEFENSERIADEIYASIQRDFADVDGAELVEQGSDRDQQLCILAWECLASRKLNALAAAGMRYKREEALKRKRKQEDEAILRRRRNQEKAAAGEEAEEEEEAVEEEEEGNDGAGSNGALQIDLENVNEEEFEAALYHAIDVYEVAIKKIIAPQMWQAYLEFCLRLLRGKASSLPFELLNRLTTRALLLCQRAYIPTTPTSSNTATPVVTPEIFEIWVELLLNTGDHRKALEVSEQAVADLPHSARLWKLRLQLLVRHSSVSRVLHDSHSNGNKRKRSALKRSDMDESVPSADAVWNDTLKAEFTRALSVLESAPISEAVPEAADGALELRTYFLELSIASQAPFGTVLEYAKKSLVSLSPKDKRRNALKVHLLLHIAAALGLDSARQFYQMCLEMPGTSLHFFGACIRVERMRVQPDYAVLRRLYLHALRDYGTTSTEMWLAFASMEKEAGNVGALSDIFVSAKKTLSDPSDFLRSYATTITI
eukprot:TRINITY_DN3786_c2_g1_i2.p1 TRINITY_DN3786_c2_g1~~TRINITY_DN3786_c2_g1_i2.p1  ORF type:complete len:786 (+),score=180.22 TRINITY_DN3786_c2_g1_i2:63-2420(+)